MLFDFKGDKSTQKQRKLLPKEFTHRLCQSAQKDVTKKYTLSSGVLTNGARLYSVLIIGGESWGMGGSQAGTAPPSTPLSSQAFARRV